MYDDSITKLWKALKEINLSEVKKSIIDLQRNT